MLKLGIFELTKVVINLVQEDVRGTGDKYFAIGIEVYDNRGRRSTQRRPGKMIASNPEGYIFRREVTVEKLLMPSASGEPLNLVCSTFNAGENRAFSMRVYSDKVITLEKFE